MHVHACVYTCTRSIVRESKHRPINAKPAQTWRKFRLREYMRGSKHKIGSTMEKKLKSQAPRRHSIEIKIHKRHTHTHTKRIGSARLTRKPVENRWDCAFDWSQNRKYTKHVVHLMLTQQWWYYSSELAGQSTAMVYTGPRLHWLTVHVLTNRTDVRKWTEKGLENKTAEAQILIRFLAQSVICVYILYITLI